MIPEYERGKTATLYTTISQNGVRVDPTTISASVYYKGTVKLTGLTPVKNNIGFYYVEISLSDDWTLDYYSIVWTGTVAGVSFQQSEIFKVIKTVTQEDISLPANSYCSANDVLKELSGVDCTIIPGYLDVIISYIQFMKSRIHARTGRTFETTRITEYQDGNGARQIALNRLPIQTIHSLVIFITTSTKWWEPTRIAYINCTDTQGNVIRTASTPSEYQYADIVVDCINGTVVIPDKVIYAENMAWPFYNYTFYEGLRNVKIDYTYGFTTTNIPDEIRLLNAKMAAVQFLQINGDQLSGGAIGLSTDGFGRSYAGGPFGPRIELLNKDIEEILTTYRRIGVN